ncbi:MAG TPA: hypothetical protein VGH03_17855 [Caulobacteraceae bacterium]|jgi:hypothetical protein
MTGAVIRIERDPDFWTRVASDPAVAVALGGMAPEAVGAWAGRAEVLPLASAHGGFLLTRLDPLGMVAELHTLFMPEGWGREVVLAGIAAIGAVWTCGFQTIVTLEMKANPHSRPARTFGFQRCGDWKATPWGDARQWLVTRESWNASPAARRRARTLD